jgi:hypothetical protein
MSWYFSTGRDFRPPATSVFANSMLTISKESFYLSRLRFLCPIVTDPNTHPVNGRAIYFVISNDPAAFAKDWAVNDCHIEGFSNAIVVQGGANNCRIQRNFMTGQWSDCISGPNWYDSCFITDNVIEDGGYANLAEAGSGAIRIGYGGLPNTALSRQMHICRNHIARWYNHPFADGTIVNQSMIDCFSASETLVNITDNVIENSGGSIELKTVWVAGGPNLYKGFNISNNTIRHTGDGLSGAGITAFYAGSTATGDPALAPMTAHLKISNNHFFGYDREINRGGGLGIFVSGYDDASILNNILVNLDTGIRFEGPNSANVSHSTAARDITISGNVIKSVSSAIWTPANNGISNLYILNW